MEETDLNSLREQLVDALHDYEQEAVNELVDALLAIIVAHDLEVAAAATKANNELHKYQAQAAKEVLLDKALEVVTAAIRKNRIINFQSDNDNLHVVGAELLEAELKSAIIKLRGGL